MASKSTVTLGGGLLANVLACSILAAPACAEGAAADSEPQDSNTTVVVGSPEPDLNPNADRGAPYKVDRSGNRKLTEDLLNTPRTVTVIPKEVTQDIGATSFRDVARSTAGVTIGTGEGGNAFGDRIFIRGFDARNDIFIDGMRDPGVTSRELFAVEQIEIIKGPASAFGGRGTTGGSVNFVTKAPSVNNFVVLSGGAGNSNYYRTTLDANRKLTDRLTVRFNALYHNAQPPRRDWVWSRRWGMAGAVKWDFADHWVLALDGYHFRLKGRPDFGHPFDPGTQKPWRVRQRNFYGVVGRDFLRNGADIGTGALRYEPSKDLSFSSVTRYGRTYNRYIASSPRTPCPRALTANLSCPSTGPLLPESQWTVTVGSPQRHQANRYWGNLTDARINFDTGSIGHRVVTGVEYNHEAVTTMRYAFPATVEDAQGNIIATPQTFVRNLWYPDADKPGIRFDRRLDTAPRVRTRVRTWAAFAVDTLALTPRLQAVLGIRYDDYRITQKRRAGVASNGAKVDPIALTSTSHFVNGQASLLYKIRPNWTTYASWATSSNPSGEQLDGGNASYGGLTETTADLKPERNHAVELGQKLELAGGRLLLTTSLFQTEKKNAREQVAPNVFENVGRLRSRGFEFGVTGNVTPRLALFGGFTYLDARIRKSRVPNANHRRFANVPKTSMSLLATYQITGKLNVGGQAYYQTRVYGGAVAAGTAHIPGYWRFDAVARYEFAKRSEVRLNVVNLFRKRYYDAIYTSAAPFAYVAPGRLVTLTLTTKL